MIENNVKIPQGNCLRFLEEIEIEIKPASLPTEK
jgi:hypothetical protein